MTLYSPKRHKRTRAFFTPNTCTVSNIISGLPPLGHIKEQDAVSECCWVKTQKRPSKNPPSMTLLGLCTVSTLHTKSSIFPSSSALDHVTTEERKGEREREKKKKEKPLSCLHPQLTAACFSLLFPRLLIRQTHSNVTRRVDLVFADVVTSYL